MIARLRLSPIQLGRVVARRDLHQTYEQRLGCVRGGVLAVADYGVEPADSGAYVDQDAKRSLVRPWTVKLKFGADCDQHRQAPSAYHRWQIAQFVTSPPGAKDTRHDDPCMQSGFLKASHFPLPAGRGDPHRHFGRPVTIVIGVPARQDSPISETARRTGTTSPISRLPCSVVFLNLLEGSARTRARGGAEAVWRVARARIHARRTGDDEWLVAVDGSMQLPVAAQTAPR